MQFGEQAFLQPDRKESNWSILICLLGSFRLLKGDVPVAVRDGGKTAMLLSSLALRDAYGARRDTLLETLWPDSPSALASQSLNSLLYNLHRLLGDALGGAAPVLREGSAYRLNTERGMSTDVTRFEALAAVGNRQAADINLDAAVISYRRAIELYRGDLSTGTDVQSVLQRERLRAMYLTMLARLADYYYAQSEYATCLENALRLLGTDPCREDAHRLVMRCYVRCGERAQALRQYRVCESIIQTEFDAEPEPLTAALFDQVRHDPSSI
jgi:DNA-binding SARP family transcriptional activator